MIYPQNFEQKIGFDQIRQLVKGKCLSTLGMERVDEMVFSDDYREIDRRLEQVMEFISILQGEDDFPSQYFFDVRPSLKRIRVEGLYMDESELFDLRRSLETIRDVVRFLRQTDDEEDEEAHSPYPALYCQYGNCRTECRSFPVRPTGYICRDRARSRTGTSPVCLHSPEPDL